MQIPQTEGDKGQNAKMTEKSLQWHSDYEVDATIGSAADAPKQAYKNKSFLWKMPQKNPKLAL